MTIAGKGGRPRTPTGKRNGIQVAGRVSIVEHSELYDDAQDIDKSAFAVLVQSWRLLKRTQMASPEKSWRAFTLKLEAWLVDQERKAAKRRAAAEMPVVP